jgi:glyoxylate/hydroxypyruvate reductase A
MVKMKILLITNTDLETEEGLWFLELKQAFDQIDFIDLQIFPDCENFEDIEIALAWHPPIGELAKFPNLKLVISLGAGVEHILRDPYLPKNISLVRLSTPHQISQMVEYVELAVLFFKRRLLDYQQLQKTQQWKFLPIPSSQSFTMGVMGLGRIGLNVAKTLKNRGFMVKGFSRTPKEIEGINCFTGKEEIKLFLSNCNILVCLLRLTEKTKNILNQELFYTLPKGAYLINVGRGEHLVEEDLLSALDSGQIAGAMLDCHSQEPLPQNHLFWLHPRIIVTPHIASLGIPSELASDIITMINNFPNGLPLENLVDITQGY